MKHYAFIPLVIALGSPPAFAQETESEGFSLVEEGARLILRGLMEEAEPAIDDMRSMMEEFGPAMEEFATELGPVLAELLRKADDLRHYQQPEFLPNGDILIRRKPDAPTWEPSAPEPGEEIEL